MDLKINSELAGDCMLLLIMCTCLSYVIALEKSNLRKKERKGLIFIVLLVATTCMIFIETSVNAFSFYELSLSDMLLLLATCFLLKSILKYGNIFWFRYFLNQNKNEND